MFQWMISNILILLMCIGKRMKLPYFKNPAIGYLINVGSGLNQNLHKIITILITTNVQNNEAHAADILRLE